MGEIYDKDTNTFDFGWIVVHSKMSYDELITKCNSSSCEYIECKDGTKAFTLKQFKLKNYNYLVFIKFNEKNLIDRFTIQIDDKYIVVPKSWEEYSEETENRKLCIEQEWLKSENIKTNEEISVMAFKGRDDGLARIVVDYDKNKYSYNKNNHNLLSKIRNIINSFIH